MKHLPIDDILPQLHEAVLKHSAVVLHAPPGAGKTTRVPLALLDATPGRIIMLQPRRIAAASAARWMATTLGEPVGETVGYTIRFDTKVSARTRVEVVTEGILTRRMQSDPSLGGVSLVIFDEFHERSIHADLALALCLDIRKGLRPDLGVLVMSATLDPGPLAALLGAAPVLSCSGRMFPVEERYLGKQALPVAQETARAVRTALREANGDILAFLPGAAEIRQCADQIRSMLDLHEERIELHPLFGDLPFEEQERALLPCRDRRKIVLATNIAETSLTIEGVQAVIDSGLSRRLQYDPRTGMNRLVTVPVSRASAEQRKGRAGRLGPGVCYRLYTPQDLHSFSPFTPPEIVESDLAPLALELAAWGVRDPHKLSWLDEPAGPAWDAGLDLLRELGALDRDSSITPAGRSMVRLPLHPRLARLMQRAQELGCVRLGADLCAIISERDLYRTGAGAAAQKDPDMSGRVEALRAWQDEKRAIGLAEPAALRSVDRTVRQLLRMVPASDDETCKHVDDAAARLLLAAYPDRICKRRGEGEARYVLVSGRGVRLSPGSHLVNSPYLVAAAVDAGEKAEGFIHSAAPVSVEMIRSECAHAVATVRSVTWDQKEGRVAGALEERLGTLLLEKKPFVPTDEEAAPLLARAVSSSPGMLNFSREARQFQARTGLMRRLFPEERWPDCSDSRLLTDPGEWMERRLTGIRTADAIYNLDMLQILKAKLTRGQQVLLDRRAPVSLSVPSGSRVALDYVSGPQPVLAVKLQEMFGLADTPLIAEGRVKILIHLLSPAGRPVQITQDLKGFWNAGYPMVKKDLKGRYPKHPWPDDPWNAVPTRHTKRRAGK